MTDQERMDWLENQPNVRWSVGERTYRGRVYEVVVAVHHEITGPIEVVESVRVCVPGENGPMRYRKFSGPAILLLEPDKRGRP